MLFLKSLDYEEEYFDVQTETTQHWKLKDLKFYQFTIIAGMNSVGKTRTCNVIRNTLMKIVAPMKALQIGNTELTLNVSENKLYKIIIDIEEDADRKKIIKKEELYERENGKLFPNIETMLFNRETIFDSQSKTHIPYSPPDDSLTFHVRRDKVSHPYLEEIISEMRKFYFLNFEEPKGVFMGDIPGATLPIEILPSLIPMFFNKMVDDCKKTEILEDINSFNFPIRDIFTKYVVIAGQRVPMLYFKEDGVKGVYDFIQASQGMIKVIFLIVFLHLIEKGSCVLIDNVGDGLDYKRSLNVLPFLEKIAGDKQVIISTNNEILLNQTDIRNWNILYRDGHTVKAYNYENSREQLEKFAETGLSNYEYFQDSYFLK